MIRFGRSGGTTSPNRTLRVSAVLELGTGVGLLVIPSVVIELLIGSPSGGNVALIGRILGGGLVALAVAGLLRDGEQPARAVVYGFIIYNAVTAAILGVSGISGAADGILLWPAVAEHAVVAAVITAQRRHAQPARQTARRTPAG